MAQCARCARESKASQVPQADRRSLTPGPFPEGGEGEIRNALSCRPIALAPFPRGKGEQSSRSWPLEKTHATAERRPHVATLFLFPKRSKHHGSDTGG